MAESGEILIRGGRVIDPASGRDEVADVLIRGGKIVGVGRLKGAAAEVIEAGGKIVCPGLIDMHVHLREPGNGSAETVATGSAAAIAGGFTAVAAMPNTSPAMDNAAVVEYVRLQGTRAGQARVFCVGAITAGRGGRELAGMGGMVGGGAVAFSDDGSWVADGDVMRRALEYAKTFDKAIITHAEDPTIAAKGVMNEGYLSTLLGLEGIPGAAEESAVFRDIVLAELTGGRLHVAHVSTAGSVELIRQAKARGAKVTAEATIQHLTLTEERLRGYDTVYKVNPPLRRQADVEALRAGLRDGTIDCIVSDHAPHAREEKELEFAEAPFGMIGLESTLGVLVSEVIGKGELDWSRAIAAMTTGPAGVLGLGLGTLAAGAEADVTIIDPEAEWKIDATKFKSRGRNCPWDGMKVKGRAVEVLVAGIRRK